MKYQIRKELSFCRTAGRLIFLDIEQDRYFHLSSELESQFLAFIETCGDPDLATIDLLDAGLIVESESEGELPNSSSVPIPSRSVLELPDCELAAQMSAHVHVWTAVVQARLHLKKHRLQDILAATSRYRLRMTDSSTSPDAEQRTLAAAAEFNRLRRSVPIDTRCLIDSIAMTRYLARQHLYTNIVFGVCADPFSAHCWVQSGSVVLNDTVGNVLCHTPIRVI